jgi:thiosulfate reductase cytochrome b subunit
VPSPPKTRETRTRTGGTRRPLPVRLTHWVNAFAMTCMIMSGWQIYNASPIFSFTFPSWSTLGGWLAGAIAIHFAAMWLLVANGLFYLAYGLLSGYFRRTLLPLTPAQVASDLIAALKFRLRHQPGIYNAVQKLLYIVVLLLGVSAVLSGLAIWKPVQFAPLTALLGGNDTARVVHFLAMAGIVGFITVHLALVALVPKSLLSMITGHGAAPDLVHRTGART